HIKSVGASAAGDLNSTGNRIGDVIVTVRRMRDLIAPAALYRALERADLIDRSLVVRQINLTGNEHAEERIGVKLTLVLGRQLVADANAAHRLLGELAGIIVAEHFGDTVRLAQRQQHAVDHFEGGERRPDLSEGIDDDSVAQLVSDGDGVAVALRHTGCRIDETTVAEMRLGWQLIIIADAGFNDVARDESFGVDAPFAQIFSPFAHRVFFELAIDFVLRQ